MAEEWNSESRGDGVGAAVRALVKRMSGDRSSVPDWAREGLDSEARTEGSAGRSRGL
jgi:hypothetical protein